ncbi:trehalase [Fomitiporia mediterranea MF3/22]|uniref:trehalase n=1 Tax=Fomitiporia mediterranea (strain MF3/22) TaxID=694068 RepID=UPI000440852D|nr:trehalase [Fomitiporia mediterranea MF3/22]EJC98505.1 trehalase [Fomitiporia mediterranea MF3/22]
MFCLGAYLGAAVVFSARSTLATATSPGASTGVPSITFSTVVPSPSAPLTSDLPSQVPLPPIQPWCPSEIFCPGQILQTVNIADLYVDPKTFVDKPTNSSSENVVSAFNNLLNSAGNSTTQITIQQIVDFVDTNFRGEGLELEATALSNFNPNPPFLNNVTDSLVKSFSQTVHGFWTQLARQTNESTLCGEGGNDCESTLIPLNHTFIVPGGRFREQYYWDSFWIVKGLIESQLFDVVNATLQNFMDELDRVGFIPNGGRIYYLDRSQPPLFIHMLSDYVQASHDTKILERALPLAERELAWWHSNRTLNVTSPYTSKTYEVSRYDVNNSAPRPESYLTDYETANGADLPTPLTDDQKADLYAQLATGAESGWDYTARFFKEPLAGGTNNTNPGLRTLNIRNNIPICLNSILYKAHLLLAGLYEQSSSKQDTSTKERITAHNSAAQNLRAAILDLFWDSNKLAFYDFNLTSNARNDIFSTATFYPFWTGIIPDELLSNETAAFGAFSSINLVMKHYNGTFPTTFLETGLQWDAPNSWPPHQQIMLEALSNIPSNISTTPVPASGSSFSLIPSGQLGIDVSALPGQPLASGGNASAGADINTLNGTVVNGGNATENETWAATLQRELANRYITSALCSWHATGGSIPGVLPRLSDAELNVTQSVNNTGNMFEKFSASDVDSAGRGGEYTVQAGFGWTNGVVLWVASRYGKVLAAPTCPPLLAAGDTGSNSNAAFRAVETASVLVFSIYPFVILIDVVCT